MNLLFVVTRNEADLLRQNLEHHLAWGFDHALVADNESDDATPEVLLSFGDAITHLRLASFHARHVALGTLLARAEARLGEARWVAVSDTDEFWWAPLPGVGALARRNFPVLAGLGARNDTSIFVSRGVGTVYVPVRINCPPEVALITLRGAKPRPA